MRFLRRDPNRIRVPRHVVERLRQLAVETSKAEAEARGLIGGYLPQGRQLAGFDDGKQPALLLEPEAPDRT